MRGFLAILGLVLLCGCSAWATEDAPPLTRRESVSAHSDYINIAQDIGLIRLEIPSNNGGTTTVNVCTSLFLRDALILTARHCFYDETGARINFVRAYVVAGKTEGKSGDLIEIHHDPKEENATLDYAIFDTYQKLSSFNFAGLKIDSRVVEDGQDLAILHFPSGVGSLTLTRLGCVTARPAIVGDVLHHKCDTEPGSSGAPIYDGKLHLIGLHLKGGLTQDPASFNSGVTIAALRGQSPIIASALSDAQAGATVLTVSQPISAEYKCDFNAYFIQRGDDWGYKFGDDAPSSLVPQDNSGDDLLFWNPPRDTFFRFRKEGGSVSARKATSEHWVEIGHATRIK